MPTLNQGRTLTQLPITQAAAGSLDLVAAPGVGMYVYATLIVVTLSAAGTLKFQENAATDLTGALDVAAQGGMVVIGNGFDPILHTKTSNLKLNLVSTVGAAHGWLRYFVSPEKPE